MRPLWTSPKIPHEKKKGHSFICRRIVPRGKYRCRAAFPALNAKIHDTIPFQEHRIPRNPEIVLDTTFYNPHS